MSYLKSFRGLDERRENRGQNRLEILWKYFKPCELRSNNTFHIYSFVHTRIKLSCEQTVSLLQGVLTFTKSFACLVCSCKPTTRLTSHMKDFVNALLTLPLLEKIKWTDIKKLNCIKWKLFAKRPSWQKATWTNKKVIFCHLFRRTSKEKLPWIKWIKN